jgi:hypothetical protein
MRSRLILAATVAFLSLAAERQVLAGHGDFQYGSTVTPSPINPTGGNGPGSQISQAGEGNFTTPTAPTFNAGIPGGAAITVGTINVTDLSIGAYMDTYGPTTVTIDVKILDVASSLTGTFAFTATLSGLVSSDGTTSAANISVTGVSAPVTEMIGGVPYTVSAVSGKFFAQPGSPPVDGTGLNGVYTLNVSDSAIPEPSSLALLGIGMTGFFAFRRLFRRTRVA